DPDPGRGHRRAGHRVRAPGAGCAGAADAGPHDAGHRAPAVDHRGRRPGAGHGRRPHRRAWHPYRTAGARRTVRAPAPHAIPRGAMSQPPAVRREHQPHYWYSEAPVPLHMRLLAPVYGALSGRRRRMYSAGLLRRRHPGVPVVVVGNITAGGAGKTPLTSALAERLRSEGWNPGVASRGYGRADASRPTWVEADTPPERSEERRGGKGSGRRASAG